MTSCLLDLEQQAAELPFEQQRLLISFYSNNLIVVHALICLRRISPSTPNAPIVTPVTLNAMENLMAVSDIAVMLVIKRSCAPACFGVIRSPIPR